MEPGIRVEPQVYRSKIDASGRVLLPAELRAQHGLECGDPVILVHDAGGIEVRSTDEAVRAAQALFKQAVPPERVLSAELLQDRREEAERE